MMIRLHDYDTISLMGYHASVIVVLIDKCFVIEIMKN